MGKQKCKDLGGYGLKSGKTMLEVWVGESVFLFYKFDVNADGQGEVCFSFVWIRVE